MSQRNSSRNNDGSGWAAFVCGAGAFSAVALVAIWRMAANKEEKSSAAIAATGQQQSVSNTMSTKSYETEESCEYIPAPKHVSKVSSDELRQLRLKPWSLYRKYIQPSASTYIESMNVTRHRFNAIEVPKSFSWLDIRPQWIADPVDQGDCGACWAFAACQALSDRFRIWSRGKWMSDKNNNLSIQCLIECSNVFFQNDVLEELQATSDKSFCNEKCGGGSAILAYKYIKREGLPLEKVRGYRDDNMSQVRQGSVACSVACRDAKVRYRCSDYYMSSLYHTRMVNASGHVTFVTPCEDNLQQNMLNITRDIYLNGPVTVAMNCYSDLEDRISPFSPRKGYFNAETEVYTVPKDAIPVAEYRGTNAKGMTIRYTGDHIQYVHILSLFSFWYFLLFMCENVLF